MYEITAKFKSANIFIPAAWDQTAKFKDCQYFRLYGILYFIPGARLAWGYGVAWLNVCA